MLVLLPLRLCDKPPDTRIYQCSRAAWGSTNTNPRGENLFEFILSTDLALVNIRNKPTFVNKLGKEVLDITLCTQDIFPQIYDWNVTNSILNSDHKCINFKINLDSLPSLQFRNPASTNWELYKDIISKNINSISPTHSINNSSDLDLTPYRSFWLNHLKQLVQ